MDRIFDTTREDVEKMTWDEVKDLIGFMLRNDLYEEFCKHIGGAPHVVRHDVELNNMNKINQDDVAKALGHMDDEGNFIT